MPAVLLGSSSNTGKDADDKDDTTTTTNGVAMDMEAFARDLAGFCKHRDKSVATAAKGWTNFVREHHPALLQGKDRGMTGSALHRAQVRPAPYGQRVTATGVAGADLLVAYEQAKRRAAKASQKLAIGEENDDGSEDQSVQDDEEDDDEVDDDDEGEWHDVSDDSDAEDEDAPQLVKLDGDTKADGDDEEEEASDDDSNSDDGPTIDLSKMTQEERELLKQEVSSHRIFSAADFVKMRKLVEREERVKRDPREAARRKRALARGQEFEALSDDDDDDESEDEAAWHVHGAVQPSDLMALATRKRQSKAEKLEKILAGRTKFETKMRAGGSTNIEKTRKKNFLMSKFSQDARRKGRGKDNMPNKRERALSGTHEAKKRRRKL